MDEQTQDPGSKTTGHKYIAWTPYSLIDAETNQGKEETKNEHDKTTDFQKLNFGMNVLTCNADVFATEETYHRMGDGWQCAQQSFGIYRTLMIEVIVAEKMEICLGDDVD